MGDMPINPSAKAALEAAAALCQARGLQFTEVRQRLLAALWSTQQPMGAYELLHYLEQSWGRPLVPTTVYRALDFLLDLDLIARIESLNAYVPRVRRDHPLACVFFVCRQCGISAEVQDTLIEDTLLRSAADMRFLIHHTALELQGVCRQCQENGTPQNRHDATLPRARHRTLLRRYQH